MPLREGLLEPIAGENPSGANLYYDKIFDQIKDARAEEVESGSTGAWERTLKRADHVLAIKLASETLATRSKDLRLAGWMIESLLKREGIPVLLPSLEYLWKLQEGFWETLYPEIEEDGNLDLRISTIEGTVGRVALLLRNAPITKAGYGLLQYQESKRVGYEAAADTSDKKAARKDAIDHGQLTPEEFDASFAQTPKSVYAENESALEAARGTLEELDRFHEDKYGSDYPGLNKLTTAIDEVKQVVTSLLNEKRKTEPDVVEVIPEQAPEPVVEAITPAAQIEVPIAPIVVEPIPSVSVAANPAASKSTGFAGVPTSVEEARAAVFEGAMFLRGRDVESPVAYLICAGLRLGETRQRGAVPGLDFAVAPSTETRQALRKLMNEASWDELMNLCLKTLTEPCARAWLDLHRYVWRAAREKGTAAIAAAVVSTIRGLLQDVPEVRGWILDDDTPVANAETQAWIDAEVLPPAPIVEIVAEVVEEPVSLLPVQSSSNGHVPGEIAVPEIYDTALEILKRGKAREAITLLARDAELQPSGRSRFQRRVQVAQLCLMAGQDTVAYPVLMELSREIERRCLETWESGEMLAHPLSLLLTCLERKKGTAEHKEAVFERLCRLDPQAAMGVGP